MEAEKKDCKESGRIVAATDSAARTIAEGAGRLFANLNETFAGRKSGEWTAPGGWSIHPCVAGVHNEAVARPAFNFPPPQERDRIGFMILPIQGLEILKLRMARFFRRLGGSGVVEIIL